MPSPPELAGFRILALLGRGGMGAVYLADDLALGRKVAIKVLAEKFQSDREAPKRRIGQDDVVFPVLLSGGGKLVTAREAHRPKPASPLRRT